MAATVEQESREPSGEVTTDEGNAHACPVIYSDSSDIRHRGRK